MHSNDDLAANADTPRHRLNPFALWAIAVPLALLLLAACAAFATGMATAPDTSGVDTAAIVSAPIDPARYATDDAQVQALATLSAATLHAQHLDGVPADYGRLDERQRAAVVAAWQAWLRDPSAFDGLDSRDYYLHAFDSYLLHLGHATGDREPLIDRGRLQLANHESLARQRWSDASIMFPDDPLLEALATEHSPVARAWHWTGRGIFHWVERLSGESMVDRMLTR